MTDVPDRPGRNQPIDWDTNEPSVLGAGCGPTPMPTQAKAEAVWRAAYVARMVERGIDGEDARACCEAGDAVLSDDPREAADADLDYWASDEGELYD